MSWVCRSQGTIRPSINLVFESIFNLCITRVKLHNKLILFYDVWHIAFHDYAPFCCPHECHITMNDWCPSRSNIVVFPLVEMSRCIRTKTGHMGISATCEEYKYIFWAIFIPNTFMSWPTKHACCALLCCGNSLLPSPPKLPFNPNYSEMPQRHLKLKLNRTTETITKIS